MAVCLVESRVAMTAVLWVPILAALRADLWVVWKELRWADSLVVVKVGRRVVE